MGRATAVAVVLDEATRWRLGPRTAEPVLPAGHCASHEVDDQPPGVRPPLPAAVRVRGLLWARFLALATVDVQPPPTGAVADLAGLLSDMTTRSGCQRTTGCDANYLTPQPARHGRGLRPGDRNRFPVNSPRSLTSHVPHHQGRGRTTDWRCLVPGCCGDAGEDRRRPRRPRCSGRESAGEPLPAVCRTRRRSGDGCIRGRRARPWLWRTLRRRRAPRRPRSRPVGRPRHRSGAWRLLPVARWRAGRWWPGPLVAGWPRRTRGRLPPEAMVTPASGGGWRRPGHAFSSRCRRTPERGQRGTGVRPHPEEDFVQAGEPGQGGQSRAPFGRPARWGGAPPWTARPVPWASGSPRAGAQAPSEAGRLKLLGDLLLRVGAGVVATSSSTRMQSGPASTPTSCRRCGSPGDISATGPAWAA